MARLLERARRVLASGAGAAALLAGAAHAAPALSLPPLAQHFAAAGLVALAVAGVFFAIGAVQRGRATEARLKSEIAALQKLAAERAQLLMAPDAPLYLYAPGAESPRIYGVDAERLNRCLATPEGAILREAIKRLRERGEGFVLGLRDPEKGPVRVRGRAAGRDAALIVETIDTAEPELPPPPPPPVTAPPVPEQGRFASLLDTLPVPVAERGPDGALLYANAAYAASVDAADGREAVTRQAAITAEEAAIAGAAFARGIQATERRYAVIGGVRKALDLVAAPGEKSVAVMALDAGPRVEAEARALKHREAHDRTLDGLKTAIAVFDAGKRLAFCNAAYRELWGLDADFLAAKPAESEILDLLRARRRLPEERNFPAFKKARADLYSQIEGPREETWHMPGGETYRVGVHPHPLGGLLYLFDDVTKALALETQYNTLYTVQRSTLDHLQEAVAFFGTDGRLKLSNAAFAALWSLSPEELDGEPHFERVASFCARMGGGPEAWEAMRGQVTGAEERTETSGEIRRGDGSVLNFAAVPMPDGATLLSFVDLTDSVRAEESLLQKNEALETAGRLKTDFIGHVSYQLRTPLTSIIGFSEALKAGIAGAIEDRQAFYLDHILRASAELKTQIDNMVDLAAIDAGRFELDLKPVDLDEFLPQMKQMVAERCNAQGLDLALEAPLSLGRIVADPARLKQILFNLLSNAIAFTPSGGKVTLGARPENASVRLWVSDTGPGIAPEHQPKAFERFESRHVGEARRGPGLGLALVRSLVEMHGGWIMLESRPGEGTTVAFHLTRAPQAPGLPGYEDAAVAAVGSIAAPVQDAPGSDGPAASGPGQGTLRLV
jgi:signal transduction histidine kinase